MKAEQDLLRCLQAYGKSAIYPFHMPGHKRNETGLSHTLPYSIDITEIDGFDDLHHPCGILKVLNERLAALYGAQSSFALVNGSTCGILAGIASATRRHDKILIARNCHKSVYNAIELLGLTPVYIQPPTDPATGILGSIVPESIRQALEAHPEIRLVVLTSPTYDGVISDIRSIAEIVHQQGIPLLVDEAHGAHLSFTPQKDFSAISAGADIVIHSLHKTLPALTQCAAAHLNGDLISPAVFAQKLAVFETSSPSYVLLASISECVRFLEEQAASAFAAYQKRLAAFSARCQALGKLTVLCKGKDCLENHSCFFAFDNGKLPIVTVKTDLDGQTLVSRLRREFSLESEMAAVSYALLMTSVCDTDEGFSRLADALLSIDQASPCCSASFEFPNLPLPKLRLSPAEASLQNGKVCLIDKSVGKISLESVWCYPPGIPLLLPGEEISNAVLEQLESAQKHGLSARSTSGSLPQIAVCD